VESWLQDISLPNPDRLDAVVLLLDELIEMDFTPHHAMVKVGKPLCQGTVRALSAGEVLRLSLSIQDSLLGISLTDSGER